MIYNVFNLFREFKVVDQAVSKFGESSDQGYFLDVHNFAKWLIFKYLNWKNRSDRGEVFGEIVLWIDRLLITIELYFSIGKFDRKKRKINEKISF